jgi:hypothetical protein
MIAAFQRNFESTRLPNNKRAGCANFVDYSVSVVASVSFKPAPPFPRLGKAFAVSVEQVVVALA